MINEMITKEIMKHIDFKAIADSLTKTLSEDAEFKKGLMNEIFKTFGPDQFYRGSGESALVQKVITAMVDEFLKTKGQEVMKALDVQAISNGVAFEVVKNRSRG